MNPRPMKVLVTILLAASAWCPIAVFASQTDGIIESGGNNGYAWSDQIGWVNFGSTNGSVHVTASGLTGYAWSANYGWINLAPTNGGVHNDGQGTLSGFAWGTGVGWIDFSGVTIDANGVFHGHATGSAVGTLVFDCTRCSVATDWRPVSVGSQESSPASTGGGNGPPVLQPVVTSSALPAVQTIEPDTRPPLMPASRQRHVSVDMSQPQPQPQASQGADTPAQLFDIDLQLDHPNAADVRDLGVHVVFRDFGNAPLPVSMSFEVLNESGKVVYAQYASTTVETERVYSQTMSGAELSPGRYALRLTALYNGSVKNEFTQPFTIVEAARTTTNGSQSYWWWVVALGAIAIVAYYLRLKRADRARRICT